MKTYSLRVQAEQWNGPTVPFGKHKVVQGDWIINLPDGQSLVLPDAQFQTLRDHIRPTLDVEIGKIITAGLAALANTTMLNDGECIAVIRQMAPQIVERAKEHMGKTLKLKDRLDEILTDLEDVTKKPGPYFIVLGNMELEEVRKLRTLLES